MANPVVRAGITLLEVLFFAGLVGSALVFLLTMGEDAKTIFAGENSDHREQR